MPRICKIFLYIEIQNLVIKLFIKKMPKICKIFLYIEKTKFSHKIYLYSLTEEDIYIACNNYCKLNPDCYINVNNNIINIVNSKLIINTNLNENVHDSDPIFCSDYDFF